MIPTLQQSFESLDPIWMFNSDGSDEFGSSSFEGSGQIQTIDRLFHINTKTLNMETLVREQEITPKKDEPREFPGKPCVYDMRDLGNGMICFKTKDTNAVFSAVFSINKGKRVKVKAFFEIMNLIVVTSYLKSKSFYGDVSIKENECSDGFYCVIKAKCSKVEKLNKVKEFFSVICNNNDFPGGAELAFAKQFNSK